MPNETEPADIYRYRMTVPLDRDQCFRRACPSCGRHFKTEVEPGDWATMLQPAFQQMGLEIGEAPPSQDKLGEGQPTGYLYCPYCGHYAEASDMLTPTFFKYLERYAMREIVLPQMRRMLSDFADSSNRRRPRRRNTFSIEMEFKYDDPGLPPRPIAGPEPPDMTRVEFLCCGKRAKILDGWRDLVVCPFCGTSTELQ